MQISKPAFPYRIRIVGRKATHLDMCAGFTNRETSTDICTSLAICSCLVSLYFVFLLYAIKFYNSVLTAAAETWEKKIIIIITYSIKLREICKQRNLDYTDTSFFLFLFWVKLYAAARVYIA
jgi:hypothetical protein